MKKQPNHGSIKSMRGMVVGGVMSLVVAACGTNPVQQAQNQQQDD